MRYIADFHIHSKYSRATSRDCVPEMLELWARRKGLDLIGTGDFTHPAWRKMLGEMLQPAEEGLYTLKDDYRVDSRTLAAVGGGKPFDGAVTAMPSGRGSSSRRRSAPSIRRTARRARCTM